MNKETALHSFLICVLLSSVLLLVGCTRQAADSASASPETDLPAQESSEPQAEDVLAAYDEAARLYDWFDLAPMPLDESDSVREGENTYFRVLGENITSTKELRSRLERVFTSELAEEIFNKVPGQYRDFDGKLYAIPGGRGANIYLLDKTVRAERISEDRWEVTLTFWADYEDARMVPEPETGVSASYPTAVAGYSTTCIYYERTSEGWRFTSFCPTDNLDLDAETVCSSDYYEGFGADCSDWELVCYLIHADGAFAEGAFYRLYQRFLERPNDILSCLALLDSSPYAAAYPHIDSLIADPGYQAAYEDEEGRLAFEETVKLCVPANEGEEAVLKKIQAAYTSVLQQEQAQMDLRFSFTVPNTAVFTLGPQEGTFPWGLALDAEPVLVSPAMDGFGPCYETALDAVTLEYTVNPDDGTEVLYKMTANDPGVSTDRDVSVGDSLARVREQYPDIALLDGYAESGLAYVWEPGGPAYCKHIAFFTQDGVVTGIEIENLMDGRLLE